MQVIGLTDEAICDVVKGRSGIALMKGRTGAVQESGGYVYPVMLYILFIS
jgi:hypothetical protein